MVYVVSRLARPIVTPNCIVPINVRFLSIYSVVVKMSYRESELSDGWYNVLPILDYSDRLGFVLSLNKNVVPLTESLFGLGADQSLLIPPQLLKLGCIGVNMQKYPHRPDIRLVASMRGPISQAGIPGVGYISPVCPKTPQHLIANLRFGLGINAAGRFFVQYNVARAGSKRYLRPFPGCWIRGGWAVYRRHR